MKKMLRSKACVLLTVAALSSPTVAARDMRLPDTTVQTSVSDEPGIHFTHEPWADVVARAKAENKLRVSRFLVGINLLA